MMILIQSHLKALPSHPHGQTAFFGRLRQSVSAKFGVGLVGGVIAGAFLSAAASGRLSWQSFEGPAHFGRFAAGRILDGIWWCSCRRLHNWCGAIGHPQPKHCTNHRTLAIGLGAVITHRLVDATPSTYGSDGQGTIPHQQPAE